MSLSSPSSPSSTPSGDFNALGTPEGGAGTQTNTGFGANPGGADNAAPSAIATPTPPPQAPTPMLMTPPTVTPSTPMASTPAPPQSASPSLFASPAPMASPASTAASPATPQPQNWGIPPWQQGFGGAWQGGWQPGQPMGSSPSMSPADQSLLSGMMYGGPPTNQFGTG
jgi:hypothetical protein